MKLITLQDSVGLLQQLFVKSKAWRCLHYMLVRSLRCWALLSALKSIASYLHMAYHWDLIILWLLKLPDISSNHQPFTCKTPPSFAFSETFSVFELRFDGEFCEIKAQMRAETLQPRAIISNPLVLLSLTLAELTRPAQCRSLKLSWFWRRRRKAAWGKRRSNLTHHAQNKLFCA